jgi:hypothetical protein
MIEIVEKIAVKSTVISRAPGKKYLRYPPTCPLSAGKRLDKIHDEPVAAGTGHLRDLDPDLAAHHNRFASKAFRDRVAQLFRFGCPDGNHLATDHPLEFLRCAECDNPPVVHHRDAVALLGFLHQACGQQAGHALAVAKLCERIRQVAARARIKPRARNPPRHHLTCSGGAMIGNCASPYLRRNRSRGVSADCSTVADTGSLSDSSALRPIVRILYQ